MDNYKEKLECFLQFSSMIDLDELNYLFGTTLVGVALRWAQLPMLEYVLSNTPTTKSRHLKIYLRLAAHRYDALQALTVLLEHFHSIASSRRDFSKGQLLRTVKVMISRRYSIGPVDLPSITKDNTLIFIAILKWMQSGQKVPGQWKLIEELFCLLNFPLQSRWKEYDPRKEDLKLPNMLTPDHVAPPTIGSTAYLSGIYYMHRVRTRLVRRSSTSIDLVCLCPRNRKYSSDRYRWCAWTWDSCHWQDACRKTSLSSIHSSCQQNI